MLSELSPEELSAFAPAAVERILKDYLERDPPDFVRLRWFLRRLAQVGHPSAVAMCLADFRRLLPAISDLCHYLVAVGESGQEVEWVNVGNEILAALDTPLVSSSEYFQLSLLSLFPRVARMDHVPRLISMFSHLSPVARREVILAAAAQGAVDWLREQKEMLPAMDPWARRAFIYATATLPREERRFFLKSVTASSTLEELMIKQSNKGA